MQKFLRGDKNVRLYSANRQQALRYYKKIKPDREYPLSIRNDLLRVERKDTKIAKYWVRIPVAGRRGGIWVAIKPHQDIPDDVKFGEAKVFRRDGKWFVHLTIKKEVSVKKAKDRKVDGYMFGEVKRLVVIAIDIGDKNPITSVELWGEERRRICSFWAKRYEE